MISIPRRAIEIISGYEGLAGYKKGRYYPYHGGADSPGVMTIGRGHLIHPGENFDRGLTLVEVDKLFDQDLQPRAEAVRKLIGQKPENEFGAILAGFYNYEAMWTPGHSPYDNYKHGKMLECVESLMQYHNSNHAPQLGLWRRRGTEGLCLLTGKVIVAKDLASEEQLFEELTKLGVKLLRPNFE